MKKQWCIGKLTPQFLWRMEDVLSVYEQAYDEKRPVICYDERPCQLIGDVLVPLPVKPGRPKREDYHYQRNGVCNVLIAFEPATGQRFVAITRHRTGKDYARFMAEIAAVHYPSAEKVVLVQDNLNTHCPGSFYAAFSAVEAFALSERFEMHYTPTNASWLNMVEIELSALSRQCLCRRIGEMETLEQEVVAWVEKRNEQKATVDWQFTQTDARDKFSRFYPNG